MSCTEEVNVRAIVCSLLVCSWLGCASASQWFRPGERAAATSPEGLPAAVYEVMRDGTIAAEVRLWSDGARRIDRRTEVRLTFEIENLSKGELALAAEDLRLATVRTEDETFRELAPVTVEPRRDVGPGQTLLVDAVFVVPPELKPHDLESFRVRWALRGAVTYAQITPFFEDEAPLPPLRLAYGPVGLPWYDPLYGIWAPWPPL